MKKILTILAILPLIACSAWAQKGVFRGNVYEKTSAAPLPYATVQLKGTTLGSATDLEGFFTINDIPVGTYTAIVSCIGFDNTELEIKVTKGNIVYKSFFLSESTKNLGTVDISAKREAHKTEVQISELKVTPAQIKALPSTGGEPDLAQYLPVLPGVISTGDQGGQIFIRGGSPVQNKILLDGMTIYNPFHSIGFFSVFETETIRNVDVLTGGFNSEYGGRISAILDIRTREGNKKNYGGLISASPFQGKVLLEGPIFKLKEEGGGSASFLFTAKHSWIDETSKSLYKYANTSTGNLPFSFTDYYGKISFIAGNGSKLNFFGFNFQDQVNYPSIAKFNWANSGGGVNFTIIPPTTNTIINGTISYSNYGIGLKEGAADPRTDTISGFNANLNFKNYIYNGEFNYGFDISGYRTTFNYVNFIKVNFNLEQNTTELAAYLKLRKTFNKIVFEPGLRFQYYASLSEFKVEPRLGIKINASEHFRLKFAGGLYSQNLISTVNERDIVNLFVGYLSGPEEDIYKPGTKIPVKSHLQNAIHAIGGFEVDLSKHWDLNVEPYIKIYPQVININRNKLKATDPTYVAETGKAYGIDITAKYSGEKSNLWLSYSLSKVVRNDGTSEYPTNFDRRHNINIVGTMVFGKNDAWEVGGRWNFGTGFPFTLTQAFYTFYNFSGGINSDYLSGNPDNLGVIYSDTRNSGRLPTYHRFDVSLKRYIAIHKSTKAEITLAVTNAYDRKNIFYFDRIQYKRVDQLPILPSLGFTLHF